MGSIERIWQFAGTFLPIYGVVLTIVSAFICRRGQRAAALVVIPLFTLWACSLFGSHIAYDGNMLYVVLALLYFLALCFYYPVLMVFGIMWLIRRKKKETS